MNPIERIVGSYREYRNEVNQLTEQRRELEARLASLQAQRANVLAESSEVIERARRRNLAFAGMNAGTASLGLTSAGINYAEGNIMLGAAAHAMGAAGLALGVYYVDRAARIAELDPVIDPVTGRERKKAERKLEELMAEQAYPFAAVPHIVDELGKLIGGERRADGFTTIPLVVPHRRQTIVFEQDKPTHKGRTPHTKITWNSYDNKYLIGEPEKTEAISFGEGVQIPELEVRSRTPHDERTKTRYGFMTSLITRDAEPTVREGEDFIVRKPLPPDVVLGFLGYVNHVRKLQPNLPSW